MQRAFFEDIDKEDVKGLRERERKSGLPLPDLGSDWGKIVTSQKNQFQKSRRKWLRAPGH
jgi:hypothetical protein